MATPTSLKALDQGKFEFPIASAGRRQRPSAAPSFNSGVTKSALAGRRERSSLARLLRAGPTDWRYLAAPGVCHWTKVQPSLLPDCSATLQLHSGTNGAVPAWDRFWGRSGSQFGSSPESAHKPLSSGNLKLVFNVRTRICN